MPPPPKIPPKMPSPPKPPTATATGAHKAKTFSVKPWTGAGEGEKMILYGESGHGKTTLASMAPSPIFIGLDDGGRRIRNPKTGEAVQAIEGVETFRDLRDALHQPDLFAKGTTCVIDTITKAEILGHYFTFETVKTEGGKTAESIEDYGWGKGFTHLTETMRLLLTDLDTLVRRGVNVLLLAQQGQATIANLEGTDYLQDGPKLYHGKNGQGVRSEFVEWADHIFRIGYADLTVAKSNAKATKGKAQGTAERAVFTSKQLHYLAKNRMNGTLPEVVSFATPDDDSLWTYIFGDKNAE